jgi:hypothetical protein
VAFDDTLTVVSGGQTLPLSQAVAAGLVEGRLFQFNPDNGGYDVLGQGASLSPMQGYIIKALAACSLRFSAQ